MLKTILKRIFKDKARFYFFTIVFFWTGSVTLSLLWNIFSVKTSMESIAYVTAKSSFEKDINYRYWNAKHGGVYVRINSDTHPNPYLKIPERDLTTIDGIKLTLMNPSFMVREVFDISKQTSEIQSHITILKPINPNNIADEWEQKALREFETGVKEIKGLSEDKSHFRLMKPLYVETSCMKCHRDQGYQVGNVRGGISISVPMQPYKAEANLQYYSLSIGHFLLWILGFIGSKIGFNRYTQYQFSRKDIELQKKELDSLQLIMNGVAEPIVVIGMDYKIKISNPAFRDFFGATEEMTRQLYCYNVLYNRSEACNSTPDNPCPLLHKYDKNGKLWSIRKHTRNDSEVRTTELLATPYYNTEGNLKGTIQVFRDVTERENAEAKLKHLAHFDTLTQLPNRLLFEELLEDRLLTASIKNEQVALFFVDLDRFKNINDTLGHPVGDKLLVKIANRLRQMIISPNIVARFGGDEFTIFLSTKNNPQAIKDMAELIKKEIAIPIILDTYEFFVSASIGVAIFPEDGRTLIKLMKSADTALYRSKSKGRNLIQFYDQSSETNSRKRLQIESELYSAIEGSDLLTVYQPQVSARTGKIIGFEALCRWQHAELGLISPNDFIDVAEETGLIVPLGKKVLLTAAKQCKIWQMNYGLPLRIAVNISPRQFVRQDLIKDLLEALEISGLNPKDLELEITETSIIHDLDTTIHTLEKILELGVMVAIDDFGTGYSNLQSIKSLPIHSLKIDKSFVNGVPEKDSDRAVIKAILALAKNLSLKVVAEGVESKEQSEFLASEGCDILQGFYFGKPETAKVVETKFLSSNHLT
ncbi:MAG TPA: EAL domain-containing protein [Leptospiraceae bacterium]|nr:EAL domain-containing protein [Leptospiraceae bacterium]HMW04052.1 EAL domain-containing protein [Leptospiraceae bacterium]HMX30942.1 EAL domain-containing protein [Leptospiraceae bacterium]HMY30046.1 EAL domain-containing protein [Leptospiraceae bacterium]HMZ62767.1 EAL domain-containing protein [Leptospiraceae bacterium]